MLTIVGLVVVAVGILAFMLSWRKELGPFLGVLLVVIGTGLQVYEAWGKLPAQCRTWAGAASCVMPALGKRR